MTEKKRRKFNWCFSEVTLFIDLCEEHKILDKCDGKRFRCLELMHGISKEMEKSGFFRDAASLTAKWKQLKQLYRQALQHNAKSGNDPAKFIYFDKMAKLMGSRPREIYPESYGLKRDEADDIVQTNAVADGANSNEVEEFGENSPQEEHSDRNIATRRPTRRNRSYAAALMEFSSDFAKRLAENNKAFLESQKQLQEENNKFLAEEMHKDRELLKGLLGEK